MAKCVSLCGAHARCRAVRTPRLSRGILPFTHLAREGRMTVTIGRRELLAALGGAAAAWPLIGRGQQGGRVRRIGVLMNTGADEPESQARLAAFMQGLQELGWAVGRNLRIDYRWSPGDLGRLRKDAAELVGLHPEVILAGVGPTTFVLQQVTRTIPIVMAQAIDPVGNGYIDSLAQPGGNTTGFTQFEYSLAGKWMELLKE